MTGVWVIVGNKTKSEFSDELNSNTSSEFEFSSIKGSGEARSPISGRLEESIDIEKWQSMVLRSFFNFILNLVLFMKTNKNHNKTYFIAK